MAEVQRCFLPASQSVSYTHLDVYKRQVYLSVENLSARPLAVGASYLQSLSLIHI